MNGLIKAISRFIVVRNSESIFLSNGTAKGKEVFNSAFAKYLKHPSLDKEI